MRTTLQHLLVAIIGLILIPSTGYAQYEELYEREGPEVVVGGVTALQTEKLYVVGEGDNLWDLSEEFFFDSMMWPALWSLNPQITNPHYIYQETCCSFDLQESKRKRPVLCGVRPGTMKFRETLL